MAIFVTEKWSERRWTPGESARQVFEVSGVTGELEARSAPGIPARGNSFILDIFLFCAPPVISRISAEGYYQIECNFGKSSVGGNNPQNDNPLLRPPKFRWRLGSESIQNDRDEDDQAILNSAGQPFESLPTFDRGVLYLTVTRNESDYDVARAMTYQNKVNDAAYTVQNRYTLQAGQIKCLSIQPADEYDVNSPYLPIIYEFEMREKGFDKRVMDLGRTAWYVPSGGGAKKLGDFYLTADDRVSLPIKLDGTGKPRDTSLKVTRLLSTVVAYQTPNPAFIEDTGDATFLLFKGARRISFAGLTL